MARKTLKKMVQSFFSSADINVHHLKMDGLINKLVAHINSQRISHATEVTQLHHEIDKLIDDLADERIVHQTTRTQLSCAQEDFNIRTKEVYYLQKELRLTTEQLQTEREASLIRQTELSTAKSILDHTLLLITNALQNYEPAKKKPRIKDYEKLVSKIEQALIDNNLLNTCTKK